MKKPARGRFLYFYRVMTPLGLEYLDFGFLSPDTIATLNGGLM